MGAGHGHHHGHSAGARNKRPLILTLLLTGSYMVAEVVGGLYTNSLALLADAGHMLSDVGALGLSLFAIWIGQKPATPQHSYGYYRTEILAALINGAALIAISVLIFIEAYHRLLDPQPVIGGVVMLVGFGGLLVNLAGLWILNEGRKESLNVRGAWLHLFTDMLGSVGVLLSGLLIWRFGWNWADPVVSFLIGLLVIYASWHLLRESVGVLLEGTPAHIDLAAVRGAMLEVEGVEEVHDLHVWTITSGMEAMSGHVVMAENGRRRHQGELLRELHDLLHERFGLHHMTIQVEPPDFPACEMHL
jgi:cobalt-zinc-cadmium efflux system protein